MCAWGTNKQVKVIEPHISLGYEIWVDACIADYVQRMNDLGIVTVGCCCGHGKSIGEVLIVPESADLMTMHNYHYEPFWNGLLIHQITNPPVIF